MSAGDSWTCPKCGETWSDNDSKVPGGCVGCVDMLRYLEYEVPGMGMVHNDVSEVVCANDGCDARIPVDPATLVAEAEDAVAVKSEEHDMETGESTGRSRVEIYCSPGCRNDQYTWSGEEIEEVQG